MATQKPISTISYNTMPFLKKVLKDLYDAHIIQNYMYICHKGEDGDKDHIHLRLEPNKRIDPMEIRELFREPEPGQLKPLGCRPFRPSIEEDWIMYAVHDEKYLKLKYGDYEKGEKLPYTWKDIKAPEDYDVEIAYIRAKQKMRHSGASIAQQVRDGSTAMQLIETGENPFLVQSIVRATQKSDYDRLYDQYRELKKKYEQSCIDKDLQDDYDRLEKEFLELKQKYSDLQDALAFVGYKVTYNGGAPEIENV